ncbi:hypothetical protein [Clostridium sp. BNL1100]|uniref:hypothetical protein n=1 Tax=Clostridium sp. BNL1100 TaxID=755731 RepID=UPI000301CCCE|nr:hypothetical protein [Clostridium sp. BNL1100]
MQKEISTQEVVKEITTLNNQFILQSIKNYYSGKVHCGLTLMEIASLATKKGERIFIEFMLNNLQEIRNHQFENTLNTINQKLIEAREYFIKENASLINSLPKVHLRNKKNINNFILEAIKNGYLIGCKIVYKIMIADNRKPVDKKQCS